MKLKPSGLLTVVMALLFLTACKDEASIRQIADLKVENEELKSEIKRLKSIEGLCSSINKTNSTNNISVVKFDNHRSFHKAVQTGMEVGKRFVTNSRLDEDGKYLEAIKNDTETRVRVYHDFQENNAKSIYDYRGKRGCFEVMMHSGGEVWITGFKPNCS